MSQDSKVLSRAFLGIGLILLVLSHFYLLLFSNVTL